MAESRLDDEAAIESLQTRDSFSESHNKNNFWKSADKKMSLVEEGIRRMSFIGRDLDWRYLVSGNHSRLCTLGFSNSISPGVTLFVKIKKLLW